MNDINTLRQHLFDALQGVKDGSMSVEQAKAVSEVSQTIINSAKLEVDFCRVTGTDVGTNFIKAEEKPLPPGIVSIRQHRLGG